MVTVRLITDPFDLATYSEQSVDALVPFLREQFGTWPETARLYRDSVAVENDVTPETEEQVAALDAAEPDELFYVVVYPGDPITAIITVVATLALTAAVLLFLTPKIPGAANSDVSANNSLGGRTNKARPNERIPDIFGTVISIPELLTYPILTFEDDVEVEVSYMCVGRGSYDIAKVRDGGTPLTLIAGAGAEFYGPNSSPNSGAPQLTVGAPVDVPFREVFKLNDVNGQKLDPPNRNQIGGSSDIRFVAPNYIETNGAFDFTDYFGPRDDVTVTGADFGTAPVVIDATTQRMRFYADGRVQFETFDPSTIFDAGMTVTLTGATFAGQDATTGDVVYVDVSGTYPVTSVDGPTKTMQLDI